MVYDKLNLGSGKSGFAALNVVSLDHTGWKNIDINPLFDTGRGTFENYNIANGIREKDNTIKEIWMGDFFEHLRFRDGITVMKECYRVLVPDGVLKISVPNMDKALPMWFSSTSSEEKYQMTRLIWGEQDSIADSHLSGYNEETLRRLLKETGFRKADRAHFHNVWFALEMAAYK